MREIADRTDSKSAQQVVLSGDEDKLSYAEIPMQSMTSQSWLEDIGMGYMIEGKQTHTEAWVRECAPNLIDAVAKEEEG